jgi:hypothetical protein
MKGAMKFRNIASNDYVTPDGSLEAYNAVWGEGQGAMVAPR